MAMGHESEQPDVEEMAKVAQAAALVCCIMGFCGLAGLLLAAYAIYQAALRWPLFGAVCMAAGWLLALAALAIVLLKVPAFHWAGTGRFRTCPPRTPRSVGPEGVRAPSRVTRAAP